MKGLLQNKHTQKNKATRDQRVTQSYPKHQAYRQQRLVMACCDFRKTPRTLGSISNPFRMHTNSQPHSQLMAITIKVLKEEKETNNFVPNCFWSLYIFDDFKNNDNTQIALFFDVTFLSETLARQQKCQNAVQTTVLDTISPLFFGVYTDFLLSDYFFANKRDNQPLEQMARYQLYGARCEQTNNYSNI